MSLMNFLWIFTRKAIDRGRKLIHAESKPAQVTRDQQIQGSNPCLPTHELLGLDKFPLLGPVKCAPSPCSKEISILCDSNF